MPYNNDYLKAILNDIIVNVYGKNPIILLSLWDEKGEKKYIDFLHVQYENILIDFNKIFNSDFNSKRVLENQFILGRCRYCFS